MTDRELMSLALAEARLALAEGEVPVGAVIVDERGGVIARAHNRRENDSDATAHAEIVAIRTACQSLHRWRLGGCALFVTLEPCPMCAGALVMAQLRRVVYACPDSRYGAVESVFNVANNAALGHRLEVTAGVMESECRALLQKFFGQRR